jgi:hypothetical protein
VGGCGPKAALVTAVLISVANGGMLAAHHFGFSGGNPNHAYTVQARTLEALTWPAATFQPTLPGKLMTLDLMPSQGAKEFPGVGYTWFDACNADIMHANDKPVQCARLSIRSEGMVLGAMSFNGGPAHRILFETSTALRWGINEGGTLYPVEDGKTQIGSEANRVAEVYTVGGPVDARIEALTARVRELEALAASAAAPAHSAQKDALLNGAEPGG